MSQKLEKPKPAFGGDPKGDGFKQIESKVKRPNVAQKLDQEIKAKEKQKADRASILKRCGCF